MKIILFFIYFNLFTSNFLWQVQIGFKMTDGNPSIPNSTVGANTNGGHEVDGNELMNELKYENIALKIKVQMLRTENQAVDQYEKEIAGLKRKLTEQNDEFQAKLKKLEETIQINKQNFGETTEQSVSPSHEMKIQLPLENWHDLLASVPRSQLGNVVSQIGHRQFAHIIQSFLHDEVRKITLGKMRIIAPRPDVSSDQTMVKVGRNAATNIPDWPMPGNINNFTEINLKYLDTSVLNFLRKFQENSLLENVNLCVNHNLRKQSELLHILAQILPLISSIHTIQIDSPDINIFKMVYDNKNTNHDKSNNHQLLLKEMMEKTRIMLIRWKFFDTDSWEVKMDWYFSWLYTPTDDGKPRMMRTFDDFHTATDCDSFIERIKKDFKTVNNPISFIIYTSVFWKHNVEDISIDNVKTNEKLVIKTKSNYNSKMMLISRYPLNAAKWWIEANEKEINQCRWKIDRKITIDGELTIAM